MEEGVNPRRVDVLDEVAEGEFAEIARRCFHVKNDKLAAALGVEDNLTRLKQLGIGLSAPATRD